MGGTACGSGGSERVKAARCEDGRAALEHGGARGRRVGGAGAGEERQLRAQAAQVVARAAR